MNSSDVIDVDQLPSPPSSPTFSIQKTRIRNNQMNTSYSFQVQGSEVIDVDQLPSPPSSPTFDIQKRRKKKEDKEEVRSDMLSNLPNDILVHLLSFVDMKTAARTSLLSKRWRCVWTHTTVLDFHDPKIFMSDDDIQNCFPYCRWVNKVTAAHRARNLNFLRIHVPYFRPNKINYNRGSMDIILRKNISKWVKFGLRKNVANLELNLSTRSNTRMDTSISKLDWYGRCHLIIPILVHHESYLKSPHLKSLHLEALTFFGPLIEKVLSNCLNLEQLTVKSCAFKSDNVEVGRFNSSFSPDYYFKNNNEKIKIKISVSVSSLKLERLEFFGCNIELLQISTPKLTSLVLIPSPETMPLEVEYVSVPSLVDVNFVASYYFHNFRTSHQVSDFSSYKLQKLSLRWSEFCNHQPPIRLIGDRIVAMISLLEACPLLHTFKLEVCSNYWWTLIKHGVGVYDENARKKLAHEHLKVIEIVGYDGKEYLDKLALCLTHPVQTPMLNKIILDPRSQFTQMDKINLARAQAKLLANQFPPAIDVVIL